MSVFVAKVTI